MDADVLQQRALRRIAEIDVIKNHLAAGGTVRAAQPNRAGRPDGTVRRDNGNRQDLRINLIRRFLVRVQQGKQATGGGVGRLQLGDDVGDLVERLGVLVGV